MSWIKEDLIRFRREFPLKKEIILKHSWYYIDTGYTNERLVIVFIHGTTGNAEIFWPQIQALSPDYRVISITIPAIIGNEKLCEGLLELLRRTGITEMVLLGTSFGGYVSQFFAANNNEMINGLILGNTFFSTGPYHNKYKYFLRFEQVIPTFIVKYILKRGLTSIQHTATKKYLLDQLKNDLNKATLIARLETFITDVPLQKVINKPLLIIETINDPLVSSELQEDLKRTYPHATVKTFGERANHFPYLIQPEEYTKSIRDFVNTLK